MSASDAPDWQTVVTTVAGGPGVTDAPDWQRVVVGPGGTPIGGGSLTTLEAHITHTTTIVANTAGDIISLDLTAGTWLVMGYASLYCDTGNQNVDLWFGPNSADPTGAYAATTTVSAPVVNTFTMTLTTSITLATDTTVYFSGKGGDTLEFEFRGNLTLITPVTGMTAVKTA
jgi:hypothetical protein